MSEDLFNLSNSVYPDEMQHYAAFHLGFHCFMEFPLRLGSDSIPYHVLLHLLCLILYKLRAPFTVHLIHNMYTGKVSAFFFKIIIPKHVLRMHRTSKCQEFGSISAPTFSSGLILVQTGSTDKQQILPFWT